MIFDTKYGNTKLVAQQIAEGLTEVEGIEVTVCNAKQVDAQKLLNCDALVIGAPNHMGKPYRTITKFVEGLAEFELKAQWAAAFDTYFQRQRYYMKAAKKLEKQLSKKLPNLKVIPGLSVKVTGVNGPVADGELGKAREFGKKTAGLIIGK